MKSESAPQGNKYFHCDFAGHGHNRKAHAPKKAIKTGARNIKYNIGPNGDEGVSQRSAQDDSSAPLLALAGGNALSQGVHGALQPAMIDVGDDRSRQKSRSHRPAEEHQAHHQSHSRRRHHVSADTLQSSSKKFVRCRGGGFKHRGHTSMYRADRSRVVDDLQFSRPSRRYSFCALTIRIICTNPKTAPTMTPAINSQWVCSQWSSSLPISNPTTTAAGMMKAISE